MEHVSPQYQANMLANLRATTTWLEQEYPAQWCLAYGTLLGWFRGRTLIPWDVDCDVILWCGGTLLQVLDMITNKLQGIAVNPFGNFIQCRFDANHTLPGQTDIFVADNSASASVSSYPPNHHLSQLQQIESTFWSDLDGVPVRIPNNWYELLIFWYYMHALEYPDESRPRVLVNLVGDLFHIGHLDILHRANRFGRVIAGVHDDDVVATYKLQRPVIPFDQRCRMIRACRFVADVIPLPLPITNEFLNERGLSVIVHGDDYALDSLPPEIYDCSRDRVLLIPRTPSVSTRSIKEKLTLAGS